MWTYADGDDALYYMRQRMFGLCILDKDAAGQDGLCAARSAGRGPGHAGADDDGVGLVGDRVDGLDAGADDYLVSLSTYASCWPGHALAHRPLWRRSPALLRRILL